MRSFYRNRCKGNQVSISVRTSGKSSSAAPCSNSCSSRVHCWSVNLRGGPGRPRHRFIGARHVQSGTLTLGQLLIVMAYLTQLYGSLETLSSMVAHLQRSFSVAERAFALLNEAPDVPDRPDARPISRAAGSVTFGNVYFACDKVTKTEAEIIEAMRRLMRGRTTFMIAHRLSTLESCDKLLVFQDGQVVAFTSDVATAIREGLVFAERQQLHPDPHSHRVG
jgi:ABC-type bacteriocin/lantibiotic exporter with double-glycine peptidase domain